MSIKDKAAIQAPPAGTLYRDSLKHEPATFFGGRSPTHDSDLDVSRSGSAGCGRGAAAEDAGVEVNERKQESCISVRENRLTKAAS